MRVIHLGQSKALPYVEIRSLTFEDRFHKSFALGGRANDLRPKPTE